MEITWLGHAAFRLRGRDVAIVTDPYADENWGYPLLNTRADVVTVSHEHPHHASVNMVAGSPRVVRGPGEYEIRGVMIRGVRTYRRSGPDMPPGAPNTSYVIQIEELTVCHLGDLGAPLSADELEQLKECHVLLVPVGGQCTIGAVEAAEVIAQVEPRIIVPMHFGTPETHGHLALEEVDRFCRELGATDVAPQPRLNVSVSTLPSEPTVAILEPRR